MKECFSPKQVKNILLLVKNCRYYTKQCARQARITVPPINTVSMQGRNLNSTSDTIWESNHSSEGYRKKLALVENNILLIWVEAEEDIILDIMDLNMLQQAVRDAKLETTPVILLYDLSHIGRITLKYKQSIADLIFNWKSGIDLIVFFNIPEPIRILIESFAAVVPDTIPVLQAGSYDEALFAARAHNAGSAPVLNGESTLTNEESAAKNEFLAAVARISWMGMLDQHISIPAHESRDHSYFKALEALQSDLRIKEKEKERELDQLTANLEQRITHMVIKMNAQTEMNRKAGRDSEKEIAELKSRIASQDIELTRVSTAIAEKTTALRNLLDQIYALEIDPTQKRQMTDACLSLIETETIEKRLNIELTESDSVFLSKLQKKHPNLNQRELRISLLVKLNYDTREIARSVGISTRGMESIRYRMHKKLGLGKHQSIKTYLSDLAVTM